MVRNFKRIFKRNGKFVRPPQNDSRKPPLDLKKKSTRKCFNCGDPNHLVNECTKKRNERAYVGGAWEDEEGEDEEDAHETCFMAIGNSGNLSDDEQESTSGVWSDSEVEDSTMCFVSQDEDEVHSESDYSIETLEHDYEKLAMLSTKISKKNKVLKSENESLSKELEEQKRLVAILMQENNDFRNKEKDVCEKCIVFKTKAKRYERDLCFIKFAKGTKMLDDMLDSIHGRPDRAGIGYKGDGSTSKNRPTIFVKAKLIDGRSFIDRQDSPQITVKTSTMPTLDQVPLKYQKASKAPQKVEKGHITRKYYQSRHKYGNKFSRKNSYVSKANNDHQRNFYNTYNDYLYPRIQYNKKTTKKWVKVGMFNANNPGPMKHWVPKV
uniref:uncharacterized protein LOC122591568 n=1 Tax=Erigeron canadensis TaxID=72917 RepID=UPI001CB8E94E|nr:uncharacterized protein LOC122591568 [Erigeron canadensis]